MEYARRFLKHLIASVLLLVFIYLVDFFFVSEIKIHDIHDNNLSGSVFYDGGVFVPRRNFYIKFEGVDRYYFDDFQPTTGTCADFDELIYLRNLDGSSLQYYCEFSYDKSSSTLFLFAQLSDDELENNSSVRVYFNVAKFNGVYDKASIRVNADAKSWPIFLYLTYFILFCGSVLSFLFSFASPIIYFFRKK
jgi:hypothetical protein